MDSTKEMKMVRDYIRDLVHRTKNDPYLLDIDVKNRLAARIVKWNKRKHEVLVCVRDLNGQETMWNSCSTRWVWVRTCSQFWRWDIWKEVNNVVCNMRCPDRLPF